MRKTIATMGAICMLAALALALVPAAGVSYTIPKPCKVPHVVDKKLSSAEKAITKAGCKVGRVSKKHSSKVAKGKVISEKPKAGSTKPAGTKVSLTVSKGK
jgi:eukaryotic-like serine/threonine-protein kinase